MLQVSATPKFRKMFSKLENSLKEEALIKIEMLEDFNNHDGLKVHKLKGNHKNHYSFSVNYKIRGVFVYLTKQEIVLTAIGDHDVYT